MCVFGTCASERVRVDQFSVCEIMNVRLHVRVRTYARGTNVC